MHFEDRIQFVSQTLRRRSTYRPRQQAVSIDPVSTLLVSPLARLTACALFGHICESSQDRVSRSWSVNGRQQTVFKGERPSATVTQVHAERFLLRDVCFAVWFLCLQRSNCSSADQHASQLTLAS
jgi:hypothetical protein